MQVQLELPSQEARVKILLGVPEALSVKNYLAFCRANSDLHIERTAKGEIIIVPPAGGESSNRSLKIAARLSIWAEKDGRGEAFDSSVQFMLPDGAALSPDAAWVAHKSLRKLSRDERKEFLRLSPEFVVEVMSPSDRLKAAKQKMEKWIANGVQLAWLIDGDTQTVYVYRALQPLQILRKIQNIKGEGPIEGFSLSLRTVWKGLA
jgi:Uma2 family endonuclease